MLSKSPCRRRSCATPGRELAARALLAGATVRNSGSATCSASADGRSAGWPTPIARPRCVTRRCSRGRGRVSPRPPAAAARPRNATAAAAWLQDAARDEHQVEREAGGRAAASVSSPVGNADAVAVLARRPRRTGAPRNGSAIPTPVPPGLSRRCSPGRRAPAPAAAHSASQRAHRLRAGGRETGRRDPDDGRRAGRAARRHHRGGAHDRDAPADRERATLTRPHRETITLSLSSKRAGWR